MYRIRESTPDDQAFLHEMLYEAIFTPPGLQRPSRAILRLPEIARYTEGWGRPGDRGLIAEVGGEPVAAVWARLFPATAPGYGFVGPDIPELSIAVVPGFRGMGLGTALLKELIRRAEADELPGLSLSVDPANPAAALYIRLGFAEVGRGEGSLVMLRRCGRV